jgi:hypothetical protein
MFIFNFARNTQEAKSELKVDTGYLKENLKCFSVCPKYSEQIERSVNLLVEQYNKTPSKSFY